MGTPKIARAALWPVDRLATGRVNGRAGHLATARQQCQHIDELFIAIAKLGPDDFGPVAALTQGFDGDGQWHCFPLGDRGALLGPVQAAIAAGSGRLVDGHEPLRAGKARQHECYQGQNERNGAECRHGGMSRRAPVNAG